MSQWFLSQEDESEKWLVLYNIWKKVKTRWVSNNYQWRHDECDGVLNLQRLDCLLSHLFRRRSKKTSKLRVTGLCEGNSQLTGEFPAQKASNVENVSVWWRHHDKIPLTNSCHYHRFVCDYMPSHFTSLGVWLCWVLFLLANNSWHAGNRLGVYKKCSSFCKRRFYVPWFTCIFDGCHRSSSASTYVIHERHIQ